jgi:potassium-transporting ATPase KdpC subunit
MSLYLRANLMAFIMLTLLLGFVYPGLATVLVQGGFSREAQGSLIEKDGHVLGSELIGQNFTDPKYFWSRLSATSPQAYNAASSTGSNFSPANPALLDAVKGRIDALKKAEPGNKQPIPVDLVTASGSGLDPHISPAAASWQASRVAKARGMSEDTVTALIKKHTQDRQFGILGEPRVNVLMLNLDLDGKL